MKEILKNLMKRFKSQETQRMEISEWVRMKYYAPFAIDETKLQMI